MKEYKITKNGKTATAEICKNQWYGISVSQEYARDTDSSGEECAWNGAVVEISFYSKIMDFSIEEIEEFQKSVEVARKMAEKMNKVEGYWSEEVYDTTSPIFV